MSVIFSRLKVFQLILSVVLLIYLATIIPFADIGSAARLVSPDYLIAGLVAALVVECIASIQMKLIMAPVRAGLSAVNILLINLITMFYSLFLPSTLAGGAVRWYHFTLAGVPTEAVLASLVFNRLVEILVLATAGLLFLVADLDHSSSMAELTLLSGAVAALLMAYSLLGNRRAIGLFRRALETLEIRQTWSARVNDVLDALGAYSGLGPVFHLRLLLVAILRQLLGSLCLYFFALALGMEIGFATLAWIRCLYSLLAMLPISISGWGVREATFVGILTQYGVAPESALLLSLLWFCRSLFVALIGGVVELERVFVQKRRQAKAALRT